MVLGVCAKGRWGATLGSSSGFLSFCGSVDVSHFALRLLGLSLCSREGSPFPILVAFPAPSSGAFSSRPGIQILRKPLLYLLLQCAPLLPSSPCCQRPLVPGRLCRRARASDLPQTPWLACGESREQRRSLSVSILNTQGLLSAFPSSLSHSSMAQPPNEGDIEGAGRRDPLEQPPSLFSEHT